MSFFFFLIVHNYSNILQFCINYLFLTQQMPTNNQLWNLFCPIMARLYQDLRHNRFCIRIFIKNPEYLPLGYFNAHNAHMSGSYKYALAEYMNVYKQRPDDPFVVFCVCVSYVHLISQKFTLGKNNLVIQVKIITFTSQFNYIVSY